MSNERNYVYNKVHDAAALEKYIIEDEIIVYFKRLGSRGFHDLFNQHKFPFNKRYEY